MQSCQTCTCRIDPATGIRPCLATKPDLSIPDEQWRKQVIAAAQRAAGTVGL